MEKYPSQFLALWHLDRCLPPRFDITPFSPLLQEKLLASLCSFISTSIDCSDIEEMPGFEESFEAGKAKCRPSSFPDAFSSAKRFTHKTVGFEVQPCH